MRYFVAATTHRYPDTWKHCKELGSWGSTKHLGAMDRVQPGDRIIVWLGKKGFAATARATSGIREATPEESEYWSEQGKEFPWRFSLDPEKDYGVPLALDWNSEPNGTFGMNRVQLWTGFFEVSEPQYLGILDALEGLNATTHPEDTGVVAEPTSALDADDLSPTDQEEERAHNVAQLRLLQIGKAVGLRVRPATSDRNREVSGVRFPDISTHELPEAGLSQDASRTIHNIDAIWFNDSEVIAAFEIEMSTSIYSGLLRMADLAAAHPYSQISLYIVATEARKKHVFREMRRPTFRKLGMTKRTKFLAYERLAGLLALSHDLGNSLKPTFIDQQAETVPDT